jgi:hypothetical protein
VRAKRGQTEGGDVLDWATLVHRANDDGEFRLHARFWNARLRVAIGDKAMRLDVRDGVLAPPAPWFGGMAANLDVSAPESDWREMLAAVPRPFYQDLQAATVHHGFHVAGDTKHYCAYYPALRRLIELMRDVHNAREGASHGAA